MNFPRPGEIQAVKRGGKGVGAELRESNILQYGGRVCLGSTREYSYALSVAALCTASIILPIGNCTITVWVTFMIMCY